MTLASLKNSPRVSGLKQVKKALQKGQVDAVFLADDAEVRMTEPLFQLADEMGVLIVRVSTMRELGKACSIDVGTAAVAILKS